MVVLFLFLKEDAFLNDFAIEPGACVRFVAEVSGAFDLFVVMTGFFCFGIRAQLEVEHHLFAGLHRLRFAGYNKQL